jgi:hypothetical protein
MRKTSLIAMALALAAFPTVLRAQEQQPQPQPKKESVVEAARKAREQRKNLAKPATVYTNDNLPRPGGAANMIGSTPEPAKETAAAPTAAAGKEKEGAEKAPPKKDEGYWRKRFDEARLKLTLDQQALEVLQRELGVLEKQYYPDPQKAMEQQYSRKEINDKRAKIEEKQKEIEHDQQALANLEDELHASGGDPGWAHP